MKHVSLLLLISLALACSTTEKPSYDFIISNVNLIDGTGAPLQEKVNVIVNGGKILSVDTNPIRQEENVIDGTGKYLIPGLFDCHVHTADYEEDFPKLIHYGITSVFIPGGSTVSNEYYAKMRARGKQDSVPAPRVFHTSQHFTMEGRHPVKTYASSNWREGETIFFLRDTAQIARLVKQVAQFPILGIKLTIEDGPSPPFVERIPQEFIDKTVEEAAKYGLEVYAHASDTEEFLMAIRGGVQNHVHFVGVDIDWGNDEHADAVNTVIERKGSWVTTLIIDKSFLYPLHPEWMEEPKLNEAYPEADLKVLITPQSVTKANRIAELTKLDYGIDTINLKDLFLPKVADIQRCLDMGVNMVLGTDAGNDFNFHGYSLHEEMQLLALGGMDPIDIIKMGTHNAAAMVHAADSLGTIEAGKLADMILLDKNPLDQIENTLAIDMVFKNGKTQNRFR